MKKSVLLISLIFCSFILCSCADTRIADIKGVEWKMNNDIFQLDVPEGKINEIDEGHSSIIITGIHYNCYFTISNGGFLILLYDENMMSVSFFGINQGFLDGWCSYSDLIHESGKEYIYSVELFLCKGNQYYDYCVANDIEFPETMTLYGYPV